MNIKPCRVSSLPLLLDVYAAVEERGLITYGGGMGELGVGRGQIQLLASLFHPDGPNDTAPGGYNAADPAADLPDSPLPAAPAADRVPPGGLTPRAGLAPKAQNARMMAGRGETMGMFVVQRTFRTVRKGYDPAGGRPASGAGQPVVHAHGRR